jgi:two-component system, OmpR family, sensor kinase
VPGLRSLRNRLAVVFGLIVLGAIGTVYLSVTPRLEDRLRNQRLSALAIDARRTAKGMPTLPTKPNDQRLAKELAPRVRRTAARVSAEILLLRPLRGAPEVLTLITDSTPDGGVTGTDVQGVALEALASRRTATGTQPTPMGREGLAAQPLAKGRGVIVLSASLDDVEANVALIRRQILYSGAIALVIALLAGYLVARALSQRVKRLEQAARKVASGDFSNPIRADSDDELGQLAAAFDDMQNQLARLDRARKQFIASASHELRTPIFSLGGFLELLADEDLDDDTRRAFLEQLRGQVDRMRMLATELLDLSRLESGALELQTEPTDLGQLAREVAAEFTPAAQRHQTTVHLRLQGSPIELECDPERVAQVLRILLDNAIVHTPAGTGVEVSAARADGHVRLEVSDRGLGIKRQNMPHIFEPFFSSDDEAQGAGLGLAIARELAERMQGELTVRSIPGSTTFSLVLPG